MRAENGFSMLVCAATAVLLSCQSQAAPADVISRSPAETGEVCSELLLGMSRIDGDVCEGQTQGGEGHGYKTADRSAG